MRLPAVVRRFFFLLMQDSEDINLYQSNVVHLTYFFPVCWSLMCCRPTHFKGKTCIFREVTSFAWNVFPLPSTLPLLFQWKDRLDKIFLGPGAVTCVTAQFQGPTFFCGFLARNVNRGYIYIYI